MVPTAKGLVLDLLSTVRSGSMPVRVLIAAGALFDIDDNHIRVTLARLLADGLVERDQRGAYRPGPASRGVQSLVAGWRHTEERMVRWDGGWIAVLTGTTARSERIAVRRNERALALLGFESLERGVALRPDNLTDGIEGVRRRLHEVRLDRSAVVVGMKDFDLETERRARALWNGDALSKQYDRRILRLEASRRRLPALSERRAMIESFTLGGSAIRQIVRDPLLPPPFVPAGALGRLVRAMRGYDEAGRACWRGFLERNGVDFLRPPMNLGGIEDIAQVAGAAR